MPDSWAPTHGSDIVLSLLVWPLNTSKTMIVLREWGGHWSSREVSLKNLLFLVISYTLVGTHTAAREMKPSVRFNLTYIIR